jgi:hypothetical protein
MNSRLLGAICACLFTFTIITTVQAAPVSGQGTWETTLQGRLETAPGSGVFLAYYDTVLDITWLTDANVNGAMTWGAANAWAAGLMIPGVGGGWRLPKVSPIDGSTFNNTWSNNATTDRGYAPTTTDGTDGGWRDGNNTPVSEMGHMNYVTLGNLGFCTPDNGDRFGCTEQTGWGLSNTGPFSGNDSLIPYWSDTEIDSGGVWSFSFFDGSQYMTVKDTDVFAWAVRSGDVPAVVPIPSAGWLLGSGLIGLLGVAKRKR